MMNPKDIERISKALSDPNRLKILEQVKQEGNMACSCLINFLNLAQPSVSHHIKQLTDAGLLIPHKEGRNISYTIDNKVFSDYITYLKSLGA